MILSLLVLIVVGLVAYFHYIQGFFSATLSAILAAVAAIVAIGFHETIIVSLLQGKMAEMAHSLVLVGVFALVYILLRLIFDAVVPGNVNVPLIVDKVGAGVMGVTAGLFAGGIFAVAAQALPFGPTVAGFARYEIAPDQELTVSISGPVRVSMDGKLSEMLKDEKLGPQSGLLIPADKFVLGVASKVSTGGSLAGAVPMASVHPDYLSELFFQKLGIQAGGKRVAYNSAGAQQVSLAAPTLFSVSPLPQADSENPEIKYTRYAQTLEPTLRSDAGNIVLIARLSFTAEAADTDNNVRLSPASVRLVAGGKNYLPWGTLDHASGPFLRRTRLDDFLYVPGGGVIDLVYYVAAEDLGVSPDVRSPTPWKVAEGTFIEAKRLGMVDLSGKEIKREDPGHPTQTAMLQKTGLTLPRGLTPRVIAAVASAQAGAGANAPGAPLENVQSKIAAEFISPINVGRYEGDVEDHKFGGSTASIKEKKFAKLQLNPGPPVASVAGVNFPIAEMWIPPDHKLVQISGIPLAAEGSDPWEWATKLGQFALIDGNNNQIKPNGAWAKVKQGTNDTMVGRYDAQAPVTEVPRSDARPTDVWIVFVVPSGTTLQELKFGTIRVASVNLTVQ